MILRQTVSRNFVRAETLCHIASILAAIIIFAMCLSDEDVEAASVAGQTACVKCHSEVLKGTVVHGPVKAQGCDVCHVPDSRSRDARHPFKTATAADLNKTCMVCHDEVLKGGHVHKPLEQKSCTACHKPHASEHAKLLKAPARTLCIECHAPVLEAAKTALFKHEAMFQGSDCLNCHAPHASANPPLLKERACLGCHKPLAAHLRNSTVQHKPVAEGRCQHCHSPHAGGERLLLKGPFAAEIHAPVAKVALCFNCHKSELVDSQFTSTATKFRKGEQNLHFVHVRGNKGRSCKACHDVHASTQSGLIRDSFEFLGTQLPIQFIKRPTGGTCTTACHQTRQYDWKSEVPRAGN